MSADRSDRSVGRKDWRRPFGRTIHLPNVRGSPGCQDNTPRSPKRLCQDLVVDWVAFFVEQDVEEDALRAGFRQLVYQLSMISTRPWPTADFPKGSVIDLDDDQVFACRVHMQMISAHPKDVVAHRSDSERAKDQPDDRDPQKGSPGLRLGMFSIARVHRAHMRAQRLENRKL
jgi:hypothetical protein